MNTVLKRILLTVIGVPLFLSIIFYLDHYHFLVFLIIATVFTFFGAYEIADLMTKSMSHAKTEKRTFPPGLSALLPIAAYVELFYIDGNFPLLTITTLLFILIMCIIEVFNGFSDNFKGSAARLSSQLVVLLYPAGLVTFLVKITAYQHAAWLLVLHFLLVFSNDVFAYVAGMLFGNTSRNIFKVSPKKSFAGLIGGIVMAIAIGYAYILLIPESLAFNNMFIPGLLFLIIAIAANTGDLVESVLKRSAGVKDSGKSIPGRGGVLDTIDSIVFSAPFFYFFLLFIQ